MALGHCSLIFIALLFVSATAASPDKNPKYVIKIKRDRGRSLLHVLPAQAQLHSLGNTLDALASAEGKRKGLLLHKATQEAWGAARHLVDPLMQEMSPQNEMRRKLQQVAGGLDFSSVQGAEWVKNATRTWEAQAEKFRAAMAKYWQRSLTRQQPQWQDQLSSLKFFMPLSSESLTASLKAINATADTFRVESILSKVIKQTLHNMLNQAGVEPVGASTRRLQQATASTDNGPSEPTFNLTEVLAALNTVASDLQGPASNVEFPQEAPAMRRRALSTSAASPTDDIAAQLKSQWQDALKFFEGLQDGAVLTNETVQKYLAAQAAGMKRRFEALQTRVTQASKTAQRRLLQEPDEVADADDMGVLQYFPVYPAQTSQTIVIMMQPEDAAESSAFIQDTLSLIMDIMRSSDMPYIDAKSFDSPPMTENKATMRRRQLRSASSFALEEEEDEEDDYSAVYAFDAAYDDEEAWMWDAADEEWANEEASVQEAAAWFSDTADDVVLLDLVVRLTAPAAGSDEMPAALMDLLADPTEASVAQLLRLLASAPAGSEISVSNQQMPRFAIFGPSAVAGFGQAAAVSANLQRPSQARESGKVSEFLSNPLRAPTPHGERDSLDAMDARWWGVVLGLGGIAMLLVATLMNGANQTEAEAMNGDDSVHDGLKGGKAQQSSSPKKGLNKSVEAIKEGTRARKTSNLPA